MLTPGEQNASNVDVVRDEGSLAERRDEGVLVELVGCTETKSKWCSGKVRWVRVGHP